MNYLGFGSFGLALAGLVWLTFNADPWTALLVLVLGALLGVAVWFLFHPPTKAGMTFTEAEMDAFRSQLAQWDQADAAQSLALQQGQLEAKTATEQAEQRPDRVHLQIGMVSWPGPARPFDVALGAPRAEHLLLVGLRSVFKAALLAARAKQWDVILLRDNPPDFALLSDLAQEARARQREGGPRRLLVFQALDFWLDASRMTDTQRLQTLMDVRDLLRHGAAAGLHVLAYLRQPGYLPLNYPLAFSLRIAGPGYEIEDYAAALDVSANELTDLLAGAEPGLGWWAVGPDGEGAPSMVDSFRPLEVAHESAAA